MFQFSVYPETDCISRYIYTQHVIHILGCQPGSVRLVGGSSPQEGRIEVCAESSPGVTVWGSVCNAQYYGIAEVVCRQLHYSRSGMNMVKTNLLLFIVCFTLI